MPVEEGMQFLARRYPGARQNAGTLKRSWLGLYRARTIVDDPFRRRSAACEAGDRTFQARHRTCCSAFWMNPPPDFISLTCISSWIPCIASSRPATPCSSSSIIWTSSRPPIGLLIWDPEGGEGGDLLWRKPHTRDRRDQLMRNHILLAISRSYFRNKKINAGKDRKQKSDKPKRRLFTFGLPLSISSCSEVALVAVDVVRIEQHAIGSGRGRGSGVWRRFSWTGRAVFHDGGRS